MAAIEREAFADPWSAEDFRECVAGGIPFAVATIGPEIAGYIVARQAADEGEILNLGVARHRRRRGIGRALVQHMLGELRRRGVGSVYLEVRESNTGARRLYRSLGFVGVGRRPSYYRRPTEDAVVLRTVISAVGDNA